MKKPVYLETVEYSMLEDIAKKSHLKPDQLLKNLIQETYGKQKR
jgi:predicted DNA-binding ribbon-helix-helix protein